MIMKKYLSIPQLAGILGISRTAVYKKVKSGKITAIRIGRSFAVPVEEVEKKKLNIKGHPLNEEEKERIRKVVDRTYDEYGEVLKRLGKE